MLAVVVKVKHFGNLKMKFKPVTSTEEAKEAMEKTSEELGIENPVFNNWYKIGFLTKIMWEIQEIEDLA